MTRRTSGGKALRTRPVDDGPLASASGLCAGPYKPEALARGPLVPSPALRAGHFDTTPEQHPGGTACAGRGVPGASVGGGPAADDRPPGGLVMSREPRQQRHQASGRRPSGWTAVLLSTMLLGIVACSGGIGGGGGAPQRGA